VTRVFGKIEDEDEDDAEQTGGERRSGDDEGVHDVWVDGSVRVAPPQSLVDALFSASSHDDAYGQTVNDPVTGGSGEDEGESLESARTWAGLWGETTDVHHPRTKACSAHRRLPTHPRPPRGSPRIST
jgi:hypothetical protein